MAIDDERLAYIGFNLVSGIGPLRFRVLLGYYQTAYRAWQAPAEELRSLGVPAAAVDQLQSLRSAKALVAYSTRLQDSGVGVVIVTDERYPSLLREIPDAPFVLYVKGRKPGGAWNISRAVAVVGTRRMTPYGEEMTKRIVGGLVEAGITVVSGLAWGIDAVAHEEAVRLGGKTIAVLGCGIDIIAPSRNKDLYGRIIDGNGAVVSEVPLGHRPTKGLFPARNRIISGLSLGTVVIEGDEHSGALITARFAADQGREVFAVPGPVTSRTSRGTAGLLKSGAKLVERPEDILEELGLDDATGKPIQKNDSGTRGIADRSDTERAILEVVVRGACDIDRIVRETNLPISDISVSMTILELDGMVRKIGDEYAITDERHIK